MRRLVIASATIAAIAFAQGALAQAFPNKPIRLILPVQSVDEMEAWLRKYRATAGDTEDRAEDNE